MRPRQGEARNLKQGGEALEPQAWYARHGHSPSIQFSHTRQQGLRPAVLLPCTHLVPGTGVAHGYFGSYLLFSYVWIIG